MKIIARTTRKSTIFMIQFVLGILTTVVAIVGIPVGIFFLDSSIFLNFNAMLYILAIMLGFVLVGYFCFLKPYKIYKRMPDVQAETDGMYLYIHSKKEAKILIADMKEAYINDETPNVISSDFIVHLLSERFGNVIIEVPNQGKYRLYFVSNAKEVATEIIELAQNGTSKYSD